MQVIFFYLIFLSSLSSGLPQSEDDTLLTADVKKLHSSEENHVPDEDNNCANVDEILRELNEERAKNRDLNQTISDILEEMEAMKRDIMRNGEKVTQAQSSVVLLSKDVEELTDEVTAVQDEIVAVAEDVERNTESIATTNSSLKIITDNLSTSLSIVSTTLTESFLPLKSLVLGFHTDYLSRYEEEATMSLELQRQKIKETNEAGNQMKYESDQLESDLNHYEDSTFKKQLFAFLQALNGVAAGISMMDPKSAEDAINGAAEDFGEIEDIFEGIVDIIRILSKLEDSLDGISGGDIDDNIPDMNGDIAYYISTRWPNIFEDVHSLKDSINIFIDIT